MSVMGQIAIISKRRLTIINQFLGIFKYSNTMLTDRNDQMITYYNLNSCRMYTIGWTKIIWNRRKRAVFCTNWYFACPETMYKGLYHPASGGPKDSYHNFLSTDIWYYNALPLWAYPALFLGHPFRHLNKAHDILKPRVIELVGELYDCLRFDLRLEAFINSQSRTGLLTSHSLLPGCPDHKNVSIT